MAVALSPKYPIPDRSDIVPSLAKDEDGVIDIGWCDGVMADGRPFRAEMWAQDGVSMLTVFFSSVGMVDFEPDQIRELVVTEGLAAFRPGAPTRCESRKWTDAAGNPFWSVNIVVGDEDGVFLAGSTPIFPYSRDGEPNTMFNPTPIRAAHRVA